MSIPRPVRFRSAPSASAGALARRLSPVVRALATLLAAFLLFAVPERAGAQCADWRPVPGMTRADIVFAQTMWDPDGAGPLTPRLVVAGRFTIAGWPTGISANGIAMWDGTTWQALGTGLVGQPQYATVYALAVYNGELYAGGTFETAGGSPIRGIARWNGTSWRPLGLGLEQAAPGDLVFVTAMAVFNGELVAAGGFLRAGGITVNNIARWNGTTWTGMNIGATLVGVNALAVYNGALYVGGRFSTIGGVAASRIARWSTNGTWSQVGAGPNGRGIDPVDASTNQDSQIDSLAVHNGELIAGGRFTGVFNTPANSIAAWNGTTWRALGTGVDRFDTDVFRRVRRGVYTLLSYNNQLIACGQFTTAGGLSVNNCSQWNGNAWSRMDNGLSEYPAAFADEGVYSLVNFNNRLIAGGVFVNSGSVDLQGLAEWDGTRWRHVPGVLYSLNPATYALAPWAGQMIVGGDFNSIWQPGFLTYDLVKWDGVGLADPIFSPSWSIQGLNPNVRAILSAPRTVGPPSEDLIIGGEFDQIVAPGLIPANRIARANSLVAGWEAMGVGFNGTVNALTRFNGSIHAAGNFSSSGATIVNHVARWDGTNWQPLVAQPTPGPAGTNGEVLAMVAHSSGVQNVVLVVGGEFTSAGGVPANRVAFYNQNTLLARASWNAMGAGFNGTVNALARFNGSTYAAGNFTLSGSTVVNHIARWDGTTWQPVGGGVTGGTIYAMTVSNGTLVVGGNFASAGGINDTENLARWDGTSWSRVGGGTEGIVRALAAFNGELHVGGQFTTVRNGVVASMGYARFLETGVPWFARGLTTGGPACMGRNVSFHARIADGYGGLSLEWRRNGVRLQDGPTGTGSIIGGSGNFTMTVANLGALDSGTYELVVTNGCGSVTTNPVAITVCPADLDDGSDNGICDGGVTVDDALYFLNLFEQGRLRVDLDDGSFTGTRDGGVTVDDLLYFLFRYGEGC